MKLPLILLIGLASFAQPVEAAFECATLHADESIRWERKGFEDAVECVARAHNNEVLFKVWFDQFPDRSAFQTRRREKGIVGGRPVVWSLLDEEYLLRITRLPIPGDGKEPHFQLLVGVPKLECSQLRNVLGQLEALRIPAQSELP